MKLTILAGVAAVAMAIPLVAQAADLAVKAPVYKAPPPIEVYSWTGCYVGGNVGGARGRSNISIPLYPVAFNITDSSLVGGGQVGCNYQVSRFVFGVEGDFDSMRLRGDGLTTGGGGERYGVNWNWSDSIRGRVGIAAGHALFYITGGGGWAHLSSGNFIPGLAVTTAQSGTHSGWVFGGGIEYGLTQNWVIGAEYLHADYGTKRYQYLGPVDVNLRTDTIRARLSYKFGWGGPLVARY